uniref:Putative plant transposon protein domain-containing protein n=1 Tax=Solanum tuberosum TaxID=4113 RepID=M1E0W6_SOLTU
MRRDKKFRDKFQVLMAPKVKNVAGSKRSRKGEASGSGNREPAQKFGLRFIFYHLGDCNLSLVRDFYANWLMETMYKTVPIRGRDVKFSARLLNELLGTPNCDADDFNRLKEKPPYRDIRHTLCRVVSIARCGRSKDTGRHSTLHFANFNLIARVWLKIVCSVLLPAKHLTEVTQDRVVLVYMLMKGMPINVGEILRQNMMKFRNNLRWRFCYRGLITRFLRNQGIEEEACDLTNAVHLELTGKVVDVTRTKALDASHSHVLSAQERQARDDSIIARMFGMAELQQRIGGRPVTDVEMATMAERYPLTESAAFLCRSGPAFLDPLDDDEATFDEAMVEEVEDAADEVANAMMVFDGGDDEA